MFYRIHVANGGTMLKLWSLSLICIQFSFNACLVLFLWNEGRTENVTFCIEWSVKQFKIVKNLYATPNHR